MTNKNEFLLDLCWNVIRIDGRSKPLFIILNSTYDVRKSPHIVFVCISVEDEFIVSDLINILFIPRCNFPAWYSTPSMSFVSNDSVNSFLVEEMGALLEYLPIEAEMPFNCDFRVA